MNPDKTLTVKFELNSCQKYWVSVWIRISLRNEFLIIRSGKKSNAKDDNYFFQIPKECLNKTDDEFSITLPTKAKARQCTFSLASLTECKVYNVEIIPIFFSLQGQSSVVEITVPPQVKLLFFCYFFEVMLFIFMSH